MSSQSQHNITEDDVKKVASLARLTIDHESIVQYTQSLCNILEMVAHINDRDTSDISPMTSPFADAKLFLREDDITQTNERELLQKIAPTPDAIESGLYLVPKVID